MPDASVNTPAVGIKTANDHVIDPDQSGQHAHRGDQPERRVTSDGKRETNDVRFARSPIAVQNRGGAFPIDIARSLNVGRDQYLIRLKQARSRDEAPYFKRSRIYDIPCTLM